MELSVPNEFGRLEAVAVCRADAVPAPEAYDASHPEFAKYVDGVWDADLLVRQHDHFIDFLVGRGIDVVQVPSHADLPWQMYTRDTAFVVGSTLLHGSQRGLPERDGELAVLLDTLGPVGDVVTIDAGPIEGGDVLVDPELVLVGTGSRTNWAAVEQLRAAVDRPVHELVLGEQVMHLDTRLTLLPNEIALLYPPAFTSDDLAFLRDRYDCLEVDADECATLGTNVFVVDQSTVVAHEGHARIADALVAKSLGVEPIAYSEPITISGSFRCSTMPLRRG